MSYRDLAGTLARIDLALDDRPVCIRPGCGMTAVPAISPWCEPQCARLSLPGRERGLAALLAEVQKVREADELKPSSLDVQDLTLLSELREYRAITAATHILADDTWVPLGSGPVLAGQPPMPTRSGSWWSRAWSRLCREAEEATR